MGRKKNAEEIGKVEVKTKDFRKALGKLTDLTSSGTIPILGMVLMDFKGGEFISLAATDLAMRASVTVKNETPGSAGFKAAIAGKRLCKALAAVDAKKLSISHETRTGGGWLSIEFENGKSVTPTLDPEEFPSHTHSKPLVPMFPVAKGPLLRALGNVAFSASADDSRKVLHGICMKCEAGVLEVATTDGKRLAMTSLKIDVAEKLEAILPIRAAAMLAKLADDPDEEFIQMEICENSLSFNGDSWQMTTQLVEGNYPNYRHIIPPEYSQQLKIESLELKTCMEFVREHLEDGGSIKMELESPSIMRIHGESSNGKCEFRIAADGGEKFKRSFNPAYLADYLKIAKSAPINISDNSGRCPVKFQYGDLEYYLMPMYDNGATAGAEAKDAPQPPNEEIVAAEETAPEAAGQECPDTVTGKKPGLSNEPDGTAAKPEITLEDVILWYETTPLESRTIQKMMRYFDGLEREEASKLFDQAIEKRHQDKKEKAGQECPDTVTKKKTRKAKSKGEKSSVERCRVRCAYSYAHPDKCPCESKKKNSGKHDTMAAERTLTEISEICGEENGGCCQCEQDCNSRQIEFGNAVACKRMVACSAECPRYKGDGANEEN
jgi:DNA polymerase III subunit beta